MNYIIENLTDYFILNNNWKELKSKLLEHENPVIVLTTVHDLIILNQEKQYKYKFPRYKEFRDCPENVQEKFKPMFKKHYKEIFEIVQIYKNSKIQYIKHKYTKIKNAIDYYKLNN